MGLAGRNGGRSDPNERCKALLGSLDPEIGKADHDTAGMAVGSAARAIVMAEVVMVVVAVTTRWIRRAMFRDAGGMTVIAMMVTAGLVNVGHRGGGRLHYRVDVLMRCRMPSHLRLRRQRGQQESARQ